MKAPFIYKMWVVIVYLHLMLGNMLTALGLFCMVVSSMAFVEALMERSETVSTYEFCAYICIFCEGLLAIFMASYLMFIVLNKYTGSNVVYVYLSATFGDVFTVISIAVSGYAIIYIVRTIRERREIHIDEFCWHVLIVCDGVYVIYTSVNNVYDLLHKHMCEN